MSHTNSENQDEIGLIPCPEARYNRSPIVLVENKLGVESWCVKFLLPYVHNKLLLYRTRKQWLNRDENHNRYKKQEERPQHWSSFGQSSFAQSLQMHENLSLLESVVKSSDHYQVECSAIDRCHMHPAASKPRLYHCMEREYPNLLYKQNATDFRRKRIQDCKSNWLLHEKIYILKELILSGTLNPIKDLHLGKLALTKFPKSPETWIHRRWVLQQLIQETSLPSFVTKGNLGTIPAERAQRLIQEEMEVCGEAAGRYPSNYNAWSHRIWVLQHLAKLDVKD
ncbi:Protein prenyltransferase alpha subunit repeat-containing protein 1 [Saguinus oedipus]|uniref:Protein prenyltransferase alpha subunit repeat-containing protein 1 n=1 Tax=Saguinus oedipus TaxID=9490 RepID=A0ABQ9WEV9_SAGOE|nr:Protein prenyltransferase alpha subunit repeat-containing protein 1 [Saguinus oedipus]